MNTIIKNKFHIFSILTLLSLCFVSCSQSNDYSSLIEEGKTAFYDKDYVKARKAFSKCAKAGDSQGQFWLAYLTLSVRGKFSDTDTLHMSEDQRNKYVFDLMEKSANQNDADGYYGLFLCYYGGIGVAKDEKKALELLDKSVELQSSWGYATQGSELVKDTTNTQNVKKGIELLQKSVAAKNYEGIMSLAVCYIYGIGVPEDINKGMEMLQDAAKHNNHRANDLLARLYFMGYKSIHRMNKKHSNMPRMVPWTLLHVIFSPVITFQTATRQMVQHARKQVQKEVSCTVSPYGLPVAKTDMAQSRKPLNITKRQLTKATRAQWSKWVNT